MDTVLDRTIALKAIRLAFPVAPQEQDEFERRFFAEAQIAARLSHPNIVVVHDVGRDPETGTLFMALEHLDGQPLSAIVSPACPMPWREALRIVQRVAEALHHAHRQGVVHRTEHLTAAFRRGDRRVLTARLGGLFRKTLSLRWQ